jgi:hypothetical protein
MKIPLEEPITAYFVGLDSIVPIVVKHRFTDSEARNQSFSPGKAIWIREGRMQWPPSSGACFLHVKPSQKGLPFAHPSVAYSIEEAATLLKAKWIYQAAYYRTLGQSNIKRAGEIETTNWVAKVLGPEGSESYVSPFTGKEN